MKRRGWWSVGLAAALLAPSLTVQPAVAGPFDYIKKADEEKNKAQEQQREQARRADEQRQRDQERQREAAERARQEQDRARQAEQQRQATERARQEAAHRKAAERARQAEQQRQAAERARQQEQQRQAELQRQAAERARQAEQQRLIEQQRQAERQRQVEHQERVRQNVEQQRARQEQQAREEQVQQEQARRLQEEQAQREQHDRAQETQQEHARRTQAEQIRQQQLRQQQLRQQPSQQERFHQEQLRRQQFQQVSQQQSVSARQRVAGGPFSYIRKADEARGRTQSPAQPQAPRRTEPVYREQPRSVTPERAPAARSNPFGRIPHREQAAPYRGVPSVTPRGTVVRESPFGSVRRDPPSGGVSVPTHTETPRASGTFTPQGSATAPPSASPGGSPFGSVRTREPATIVTPQPRGGQGSLGGYFNRNPQPHRERDRRPSYPGPYYPGPSYGGGYPDPYYRDRYGSPGPYYEPCPYDIYPPVVIYPRPEPTVVIVPPPEVVVVPERESDRGDQPDAAQTALLADAIGAVEEAWESGQLSLLMRHIAPESKIDVYRDGAWAYALTSAEFEEKTRQAFRDYDTVSMEFGKPEFLNEDEARARAEHVYRTRSGQRQRVYVTYTFRRYGKSWRITALDYERPVRTRAAVRPNTPGATPAQPAAPSPAPASPSWSRWDRFGIGAPGQLSLVAAPAVRLRDLLTAPRPRRLATLKWLQAGKRTLYTLEAMRGVAPGTVAWALYPQGSRRPVESGLADVGALPASGWVAVRTVAAPLMTLAAQGSSPARHPASRVPKLATRTFAETNLALVSVHPHGKTVRRAGTVRSAPRTKGKSRGR